MEFEWDDNKARANLAKHGIAFEDIVDVFDDPVQLREPNRLVGEEVRLQLIGRVQVGSGVLFVVYTLRETDESEFNVRIISARPASRKERARYERT